MISLRLGYVFELRGFYLNSSSLTEEDMAPSQVPLRMPKYWIL